MCCTVLHELLSTLLVYHSSRVDATDEPRRAQIPAHYTIFEGRAAQIAVIRRTTATGPTGIYRCDIASHDDYDYYSVRATVYVGLYSADAGMCT